MSREATVATSRNNVAMDYSNEMLVGDITIAWLYKPHSLLALSIVLGYISYMALTIDQLQLPAIDNLRYGAVVAVFVFLIFGMLLFPSGPFIRPHPSFWRIVFGASLIYLMLMILLLFQNLENARYAMTFLDSTLNVPLDERSYAADCSLTLHNMKGAIYDRYVLAHFFGWMMYSLMIRDRKLCWMASIIWELVEICFTHWMPNFAECWWDQLIMDVMICNGIGIELGYHLCNYLEVQEYRWSGLMSIPTFTGKLHRIVTQLGPASWVKVRWEGSSKIRRFCVAHVCIICMLLPQACSFFLKHLLWIPPENNINLYRIWLWFLMSIPTIRQFYLYTSRKDVRRMGSQLLYIDTSVACID